MVSLYKASHTVIVLDRHLNSSVEALHRAEKLVSAANPFYEVDLMDKEGLLRAFRKQTIDGVIHFTGPKAVGESVQKPLDYYGNSF